MWTWRIGQAGLHLRTMLRSRAFWPGAWADLLQPKIKKFMLNNEREKNVQSQSLCFPGPVKKRTGSAKLLKDETSPPEKKDLFRREGKDCRCFLGGSCRASCFAPGWYEEKDEFHQDDMKQKMKERMNSSFNYSLNSPGEKKITRQQSSTQ